MTKYVKYVYSVHVQVCLTQLVDVMNMHLHLFKNVFKTVLYRLL